MSARRTVPPHQAVPALLALLAAREPTLGSHRLLCLDGPAGAGKTTLAQAVAQAHGAARVVHLDDLYDGWGGLLRIGDQLDTLLLPLAQDRPGSYRRYRWARGCYGETVTVPTSPLLIVEGVGAGSRAHAALATVTAWVTAPADLRRDRAVARSGPVLVEHWDDWARDEQESFARSGVVERADLVVDGAADPVSPPTG